MQNSSNRKQLNFQFDLDIQRVHLLINMRCEVQIWWKSGKGKIATKNSLRLNGTEKNFDINQKLSIMAKIVQENGGMKQKKTELLIILFTPDNMSKLGGRVYLNLSEFVSSYGQQVNKQGSKRIERKLQNCPDQNSKIFFNLSWKYISTQDGSRSIQNPNDISFQAASFNTNMTFRPKEEQSNYQPSESSGYQKTKQSRSRQKNKQLQKNSIPPSYSRNNQDSREIYHRQHKPEKPMQFSFNPTQSERQQLGIDNQQLIKDLKLLVQDKSQQIVKLREDMRYREQARQTEKQKVNSSRSLSLMNQLNTTVSQKQQILRQLNDLQKKYQSLKDQMRRLKDENRVLEAKNINLQSQSEQRTQDINNEQQKQKSHLLQEISQFSKKLEGAEKKNTKLQDQIFHKENQFLTLQSELQKVKSSQQSSQVYSTQKLHKISKSLEQLKQQYNRVFKQKQQYKANFQKLNKSKKQIQSSSDEMHNKLIKMQDTMQLEKGKYKMRYEQLQRRFHEREAVIREIEDQFRKLGQQKATVSRAKDEEISNLREKFNASCRKIDELAQRQESYRNQISTLNIRIKSLEDICEQNEKSQKLLQEKSQLLQKAKSYITSKQQQIQKRDQFINKAKQYIQGKQKQLQQLKQSYKSLTQQQSSNMAHTNQFSHKIQQNQSQISSLTSQINNHRHQNSKLHHQIQEMQNYIDQLKQKLMDYEDHLEQMSRKIQSQDQTLKDLVKKNLQMEIQVNVKNYELQVLRDAS